MFNNAPRLIAWFAVVGFTCLSGFGGLALAEDTNSSSYSDRIFLKNGDIVTGDLKELDRGKLRFKTRTMDTVFINWVDIESIESRKYLRVEKVDGSFNYGTIRGSDRENALVIQNRGHQVDVPTLEVAALQPIRVQESLWRRFEGDLSAGVDFKSASDILLVNLSSNVRFKQEKSEIAFSANWNETSRADDNDSARADLSGVYTRFLQDRWFWKGLTGFETNEELGLEMRTLVAATGGKYLIQQPTLPPRFECRTGR